VSTTATSFEIEDPVLAKPSQRLAPEVVEATQDDVTGVANIALFGEPLDHLGLVEVADCRGYVRSAPVATKTQMSPLAGVVGETGEVLVIQALGGVLGHLRAAQVHT